MSEMLTLLLRLAGPTQGWDVHRIAATGQLAGGRAVTGLDLAAEKLTPTHSGVVGFLAAALGRERGRDMTDLQACRVLVRADQPGQVRTEFRTTRRPNSTGQALTQPLAEKVLDDAIFLAGVEGEAGLINACADALTHPRWPLYLGRREFPPTLPVLLGVSTQNVETAVRSHPWIASDWYQRRIHPPVGPDAAPGDLALVEVVADVRGRDRQAMEHVHEPGRWVDVDWFASVAHD